MMSEEKNVEFSEKDAQKLLDEGKEQAKDILQDEDKLERLLQRLEKKLKKIPVAGTTLAMVPTMASLVKAYAKKEYPDVPIGSVVAIISALAYVVAPVDAIPDGIPVVGYADDAAVVTMCLKLVQSDIDEYLEWREKSGKNLVV